MSKRAEQAALKAYPELAAEWMKVKTLQPMKRAIYQQGYEQAEKDIIEKAVNWIIEHVNIDYDVQQSEDGQPLASDYIKYAKKRFEAANQIADNFIKAIKSE